MAGFLASDRTAQSIGLYGIATGAWNGAGMGRKVRRKAPGNFTR